MCLVERQCFDRAFDRCAEDDECDVDSYRALMERVRTLHTDGVVDQAVVARGLDVLTPLPLVRAARLQPLAAEDVVLACVERLVVLESRALRPSTVFLEETRNVHVVAAHRTGRLELRRLLDDRVLLWSEPNVHARLMRFLDACASTDAEVLRLAGKRIRRALGSFGVLHCVETRRKSLSSIASKMSRCDIDDPQHVWDRLACRVILKSDDDAMCYRALRELEVVCPDLRRIIDYVSEPKPNGYQSIHALLTLRGVTVELQVRTVRMHLVAERGAAAHWRYHMIESKKRPRSAFGASDDSTT